MRCARPASAAALRKRDARARRREHATSLANRASVCVPKDAIEAEKKKLEDEKDAAQKAEDSKDPKNKLTTDQLASEKDAAAIDEDDLTIPGLKHAGWPVCRAFSHAILAAVGPPIRFPDRHFGTCGWRERMPGEPDTIKAWKPGLRGATAATLAWVRSAQIRGLTRDPPSQTYCSLRPVRSEVLGPTMRCFLPSHAPFWRAASARCRHTADSLLRIAALWSHALSNSAVDRRMLWNQ